MKRTLGKWRRLTLSDMEKQVANFIEENRKVSKIDELVFIRNLRGKIVGLSHKLYKTRGAKGHEGRQSIRRKLWDYSQMELIKKDMDISLAKYRPPYEPMSFTQRIGNLFKK